MQLYININDSSHWHWAVFIFVTCLFKYFCLTAAFWHPGTSCYVFKMHEKGCLIETLLFE